MQPYVHRSAPLNSRTYAVALYNPCVTVAAMWARDMGRAGLKSERLDTYSYLREDGRVEDAVMVQLALATVLGTHGGGPEK